VQENFICCSSQIPENQIAPDDLPETMTVSHIAPEDLPETMAVSQIASDDLPETMAVSPATTRLLTRESERIFEVCHIFKWFISDLCSPILSCILMTPGHTHSLLCVHVQFAQHTTELLFRHIISKCTDPPLTGSVCCCTATRCEHQMHDRQMSLH
jgi:hypothetical protein